MELSSGNRGEFLQVPAGLRTTININAVHTSLSTATSIKYRCLEKLMQLLSFTYPATEAFGRPENSQEYYLSPYFQTSYFLSPHTDNIFIKKVTNFLEISP